jgi:hypothetical protein
MEAWVQSQDSVRIQVDKVTMGEIFSKYFGFCPSVSLHQCISGIFSSTWKVAMSFNKTLKNKSKQWQHKTEHLDNHTEL